MDAFDQTTSSVLSQHGGQQIQQPSRQNTGNAEKAKGNAGKQNKKNREQAPTTAGYDNGGAGREPFPQSMLDEPSNRASKGPEKKADMTFRTP